ncbi:MAG: glycosyltransferase family 4 protein [Sphingorhabdus sp.]
MKFLICCSLATSLRNFRGKLLKEIRNNGHDIIALAPDFDDEMRNWCSDLGISTEHIDLASQGLNPLSDLSTIWQMRGIMRRHRPDVVMGYTHKPALYTAYAAKLAAVPHVSMMVTGMGFGFEPGGGRLRQILIPLITTNMFRLGCAACDTVIFHNRDNHDYFLEKGILRDQKKGRVVGGSGVDLNHFEQLPLPQADAEKLTFLLIARIVRYKGIMEYAQAVVTLKQKYPDARFLLAGYYDKNPLSYTKVEWDFIEKHVTYLGESKDVRQLYVQAHVYVLPSYGEGMPRTVLEAMASGRAIITSDTYGCRDTVVEGVNGHLVPIKQPEPLADAMESFLAGRSDWRAMGEESLKLAKSKFDVDIVNKEMIAAMQLEKTPTHADG